MKKKWGTQLAQLVDMGNPAAVFEEVKYNFVSSYSISDFRDVRFAFNDFNDLFEGKYCGYRSCNTKFHDKIHTTDALLAISRLIDGYNLSRPKIPVNKAKIALIATILHDTGYIQTKNDKKGTGAKYTLNHVERSINFIKKYFQQKNFSEKDFALAKNMVSCTGFLMGIPKLSFDDVFDETLGYMLGTADLLGQMASRTYLERLIYLYQEFKEGRVQGYDSEYILLQKTLKFYDDTKIRIENELGGVYEYLVVHFFKRYRINEDMYQTAIKRQIEYLGEILKYRAKSYRKALRRKV